MEKRKVEERFRERKRRVVRNVAGRRGRGRRGVEGKGPPTELFKMKT